MSRKRCAAPGCTSASESTHSFFTVPKSAAKRKLWEKSLDISLRETQVVCELHFKKEDITKEHIFYRQDKTILQTVGNHYFESAKLSMSECLLLIQGDFFVSSRLDMLE